VAVVARHLNQPKKLTITSAGDLVVALSGDGPPPDSPTALGDLELTSGRRPGRRPDFTNTCVRGDQLDAGRQAARRGPPLTGSIRASSACTRRRG
jgi:hypothetical protein